MKYFLQFPSGGFNIILDSLSRSKLSSATLAYHDESSLILELANRRHQWSDARWASSVFAVLGSVSRHADPSGSARRLAREIRSQVNTQTHPITLREFRVMAYVDGKLCALDRRSRTELESALIARFGGRISARGGGQEVWVLMRRDMEEALLGLRVLGSERRRKGALSRELAALMAAALVHSTTSDNQVVLDPFAGSGALLAECQRLGFRRLVYNDRDPALLQPSLFRGAHTPHGMLVYGGDGLNLRHLSSGSVGSIITDPPWGEYDRNRSDRFDRQFSDECHRLLHPQGRLILVINRQAEKPMIEELSQSNFDIDEAWPILLNGHPATILRAFRR